MIIWLRNQSKLRYRTFQLRFQRPAFAAENPDEWLRGAESRVVSDSGPPGATAEALWLETGVHVVTVDTRGGSDYVLSDIDHQRGGWVRYACVVKNLWSRSLGFIDADRSQT